MFVPRALIAAAAAAALSLPAAATAAPLVVADPDGTNTAVIDDPALPRSLEPFASSPPPVQAAVARSAASTSLPSVVNRLRKRKLITAAAAKRYRKDWSGAVRAAGRMGGARGNELRAVLTNTRNMAAAKELTASRLPAVMLTVARNRNWWSNGPSLPAGGRTRFRGSQLIWQYYPGQGLQIQWLGTFGRANALWSYGGKDDELADILAEARGLAANRAGGIAYEYLFRFGGGRPGWVSGLAQGTALTAFSRGALRLKNPKLFGDARAALGIFKTAPPRGVRVKQPPGVHYLQYSYAPSQRIGNGFVQSLNGLHDLARFANNDEAWKLLIDGERHLRTELQRFDTGAWSLYQHTGTARSGPESNLDYHKLFLQFLDGFCTRLTDDRELASASATQATAGGGAAPTAETKPRGRSKYAGRTSPARYCNTAGRFRRYLKERPKVRISSTGLRAKKTGTVLVRLNKISNLSVTVSQRGRQIGSRGGLFGRGTHRISVSPKGKGKATVSVTATDLAGNRGTHRGTLRVRPKPR
jgi:hypothetical protein